MIYLLERNQIISHSVNKSERHLALSEITKFISLSIVLVHITSYYGEKKELNNTQISDVQCALVCMFFPGKDLLVCM